MTSRHAPSYTSSIANDPVVLREDRTSAVGLPRASIGDRDAEVGPIIGRLRPHRPLREHGVDSPCGLGLLLAEPHIALDGGQRIAAYDGSIPNSRAIRSGGLLEDLEGLVDLAAQQRDIRLVEPCAHARLRI